MSRCFSGCECGALLLAKVLLWVVFSVNTDKEKDEVVVSHLQTSRDLTWGP